MPTYEYECKSCSHGFEVFQSMNDQPIKDCPKCGNEVQRLIFGGAGVIFKGSGFYATDKSKSAGNKKETDKKIESVTGQKGDSSSSKSAATPTPCATCPNKGASASCPA